ncbi:hypothetical protein NC653_000624 [Populus alba x Populus x berolinensis]|uniref:Uncharacterized protein n=1 Tax=Populus alba x Populus x berolinensis TaxID=444605 RepID=A0AAD6WFK4_9ROSI|nr:hypothetical protein NC653_000624 [Populus alba x Populus x berolinensis]
MGKVSRRSAGENESIDWKKASRNSLQRIFRQVMGKKLRSMDILASTTFSIYKAYQEVLGVKVTVPPPAPEGIEEEDVPNPPASGSGQCGEDLLETMNVEEKLLRRRWGQFMEAKRRAGSPVKTALLRRVAKESAVDGG